MTQTARTTTRKAYLVLGCKTWDRRVYDETLASLPGKWRYVGSPDELSAALVREFAPQYLFFLHWSWKVPREILERRCRASSLAPYTALRMSHEFDAGPVYLKESLSLEGSAEEIYLRAAQMSGRMIERFTHEKVKPKAQRGEVVNFKRRKPEESEIDNPASLEALHDMIRMLDADGYPRAFLNHGGFRFEFSRSALYDGRVVADVRITPIRKGGDTQP